MNVITKRDFSIALRILCICTLILVLASCGSATPASAVGADTVTDKTDGVETSVSNPAVTVSASGTVRLTPDKANVTFGVTTQEATADEAQSINSEAVKNVISKLTEQGIEEKSFCTTGYTMYPQYEYSDDTGENRIKGYYINTSITVQDQDITSVGKLISDCVAAGVNNVDGVSFFCREYEEAYRQALTQAISASKEKAEVLAGAAGKKLGEIIIITEGWEDTSTKYGKAANISMEDAAMNSAGPILQPGEIEITANVTVTYRMN